MVETFTTYDIIVDDSNILDILDDQIEFCSLCSRELRISITDLKCVDGGYCIYCPESVPLCKGCSLKHTMYYHWESIIVGQGTTIKSKYEYQSYYLDEQDQQQQKHFLERIILFSNGYVFTLTIPLIKISKN